MIRKNDSAAAAAAAEFCMARKSGPEYLSDLFGAVFYAAV